MKLQNDQKKEALNIIKPLFYSKPIFVIPIREQQYHFST